MEILRKQLLQLHSNLQNNLPSNQSYENNVENTYFTFLRAMLNILSKYDPQVLSICETVRSILVLFFVILYPCMMYCLFG